MTGGGGDRGRRPPPPSSSSPTTGGEFLLQLLQKPQTQCHSQTPINFHSSSTPSPSHPSPPLHHRNLDPAVAAMGPSLSFPSNSPPWIESTNFPAPLPSSNTHTPWGLTGLPPSQLAGNYPPIFPDEFQRLGLLGGNKRNGNQPPHHQQKEQTTMMFGSLPGDFRNHGGLDQCNSEFGRSDSEPQFGVHRVREVVGASSNSESSGIWCNPNRSSEFDEVESYGSHNLWNNSPQSGERGKGMPRLQQHVQSQISSHMVQQRSAPPGFPQKPKGIDQWGSMNARRELEGNVGKQDRSWGKLNGHGYHSFDSNGRPIRNNSSSGRGMQGNVSSRLQLSGQLDHPGPPMGSNLPSVPALDIEESLATLHAVEEDGGYGLRRNENKSRNNAGGPIRQMSAWRAEDDLSEQLMNSIRLKNGWEKNIGRHLTISDDKDLRLGISRELQPPGQRMRNSRRVVDCRNDIDKMNAPFLAIYESLVPAEEEKAKQKQLLALLERLVNKEWPKAQLYLYGSCANSFGVSKSDIDVCLAIEDRDINKSELLLKLADILQEDNLENVQALTRARVPIVKLMDPVTGISCDICVNNVLAVVNTKLLRDYAQIDERLRQLAFIVKHWAKSRGVNVTYHGTLSSYAYVLMCIHFLQQRKPAILPCLQEMEATYVVSVDDIECAYFDQVQNLCDFGSQNKENIAKLVWSFFDYWAYRHDYANAVISVRTGSIISKRAKDWTRRIGNDRHLICIEDPFETSHDLGRVVDKYSIKVLREEFERAANIMQYDPDPCVTLFEPYVPR